MCTTQLFGQETDDQRPLLREEPDDFVRLLDPLEDRPKELNPPERLELPNELQPPEPRLPPLLAREELLP